MSLDARREREKHNLINCCQDAGYLLYYRTKQLCSNDDTLCNHDTRVRLPRASLVLRNSERFARLPGSFLLPTLNLCRWDQI